jgi:regulator of protease activity HflC (stomatin/prohibitin superfamily)
VTEAIDADTYDDGRVSDEPTAGRRWHERIADTGRVSASRLLMVLVVVLFMAIYFWRDVFITVHSGEVGVLYLRFGGGTQTDRVLGEGLKIIAPWDHLFVYDVRVQEIKHTMDVLTSEGLTVTLSLSIRYHPEIQLVGLLHERVGPDYREKIVIPEVESALRTTLSTFPMRDVYGSQLGVREAINAGIEKVEQDFVLIDAVVLRSVELPAQVRETIEKKMTEKELAESYEYRLDVAKREAERRQIEAEGLKTYNDVLNSSLTANILKWEGIQATRELSKSPNSKTIIIGNQGSAGLPLILGGGPDK